MKSLTIRSMLVVIALCLFSNLGFAETRYVTEDFEITMRTGPGVERKILALIKSGQPLEVLKSGDEWTEVRLPGGKQGWVLSRYLTGKEPSAIVLQRVKGQYERLKTQNESISSENAELKAAKAQLETDLGTTKGDLDKVTNNYDTLASESADFLALKKKFEKVSKELAEEKAKAARFEEESLRLLRSSNIKWFLSGAGVLLLGFIIGFSSRRSKRRSSLL